MKSCAIFLLTLLSISTGFGQITVKFPPERMVFQRDQEGNAKVYISGTATADVDGIEARLVERSGEPGKKVDWMPIYATPQNGAFVGYLPAKGGRFDLELRGMKNGGQVGAITTVEKVGVGEVFLIVGHSNAADSDKTNAKGASSDLVNSIDMNVDTVRFIDYLLSGNPDFLPPLKPTQLCQTCGIAPLVTSPWYWSELGDLLVQNLEVPVLFYSAAFGGSNMGAFYKAAYNIPFSHGFIRYNIRMPYANIRNTMNKYVPQTGLRGVLSMHGINDIDTTGAGFYFRSQKVIEKSREESAYPDLAWIIATSCYNDGYNTGLNANRKQDIVNAQNQLINTISNVFRGADLNQIDNSGRFDGLHFNEKGLSWAARLWKDAIIDPSVNILGNAKSLMAKAPSMPDAPLPVTLLNFEGTRLADGRNQLKWTTLDEKNNNYFEILKSNDAKDFRVVGTVKGVASGIGKTVYSFKEEIVSSQTAFFRLNQVDIGGSSTKSKIIRIEAGETNNDFVFPNPGQDYIEVSTYGKVESLTLLDFNGKVVDSSSSNKMDISKLSKGNYLLQIKTQSGKFVTRKIVKM